MADAELFLIRKISMEPPQFPAGAFNPDEARTTDICIADIEAAARLLREAVLGLTEAQLDTKYKNWTIRQIVHHIADSHANAYVRFKLALTEKTPVIKPYDESAWSALADACAGPIEAPLAMLDGLHSRWVQLLRTMTPDQFSRCYFHPESGQIVSLATALRSYAWHGKHHTAQIRWMRQNKLK
jgi:hypothetical protein